MSDMDELRRLAALQRRHAREATYWADESVRHARKAYIAAGVAFGLAVLSAALAVVALVWL